MTISNRISENLRDLLSRFFLGVGYPAFVGVITLVGYVSGWEFYLNALNMLLLVAGILLTSSALPMIPTVLMFFFQTSMKNSPEDHVGSKYYHNPWIIGTMAALMLAAVVTVIYVTYKKRGSVSELFRGLPFPLAAALLTLAFLMNGAFTEEWTFDNTLYAITVAAMYFPLFYFFVIGLRGEERERLIDYTVFSVVVTALVLSAETAHLYITNDELIRDGEIIKEEVVYGWGMWTMAGQFLSVTIPICFLGVVRGKYRWLSFGAAALATLSAVMTLSRNSLIIGCGAFAVCAIICCFVGRSVKAFRIITPLGVLALLVLAFLFREKLVTLLADYLDRGLSDNGRFELWRHGIASFIAAPLFGKGFLGIQRELFQGCPEGFSLYPRMMHNTPIQLLGSMGIFGFLSYGYYRFKTLIPFIKKPSAEKCFMGMSLLVMLLASLIDNFVFMQKHLVFYSVILAVVFTLHTDGKTNDHQKRNDEI